MHYGPEELITDPMWQDVLPSLVSPYSFTSDPDLLREGQARVLVAGPGAGIIQVAEPFLVREGQQYYLTVESKGYDEGTSSQFGLMVLDDTDAPIDWIYVLTPDEPDWQIATNIITLPIGAATVVPQIRTYDDGIVYLAYISAREITSQTSPRGWQMTLSTVMAKTVATQTASFIEPSSMAFGVDEIAPNTAWTDAALRDLYPPPFGWAYSTLYLQRGQTHTLHIPVGEESRMYLTPVIRCIPGDKFYLRMELYLPEASDWAPEFHLGTQSIHGSEIDSGFLTATGTPGQVNICDGVYEVPDGAFYIHPYISRPVGGSGDWFITKVNIRRAMVSSLASGARNEISPFGVRLWRPGDEGDPSVALTSDTGDVFALKDDDDKPVVTITASGGVFAEHVNANSVFTYKGEELEYILSRMPQGVIAASGTFPATIANVNTEYGLTEVGWTVPAGLYARYYEVSVQNLIFQQNGNQIGLNVRVTTDGSQPTISSPLFAAGYMPKSSGADNVSAHFNFSGGNQLNVPPGTEVRMLLTMRSVTGGNFAWVNSSNPKFIVKDLGENFELGGIVSSGGGSLPGTGYVPPASAPPVRTYTSAETGPKWSRVYKGNNAPYDYDNAKRYQGYYLSSNGVLKSAIGAPDAMFSNLTGATVNSIQVRLKALHWYSSSGGTAVIGVHGYSNDPGSFPGIVFGWEVGFARGEEKWLTLPSSWYSAFKSGAYRGITLHANNNTGTQYYGYFDTSRLAWKWSYTK